MTVSIGAIRMEVSSGRSAASECLRSDRDFWVLGHVASPCKGQILTITPV